MECVYLKNYIVHFPSHICFWKQNRVRKELQLGTQPE
ncbi:Protein CBG27640 [Caenorhabditis briggsae]|uniref:Protein CBG27640 n=1 Tax=Caenorhabditis briggsae TaxID=6238 RepID=B6IJ85_CAEBR|nr:Protein CBG27640 [Caenorhabditis briggsae]CAR99919.1 Protein CBG27640 [Caenorhabditis briggsae]